MFKNQREAFEVIKTVVALLVALAGILALVNFLAPLFEGSALQDLTVDNIVSPWVFLIVALFGLLLILIVSLFIFVVYDNFLSKSKFLKVPEKVLGKIISLFIIIIFISLIALVLRPAQFAFFASFVSISAIVWTSLNSINFNKISKN